MKYIKLLAIAIIGLSSAFAQTPPMPVTSIPSHLSIGQVAVVESLAKATQVRVYFGQPSSSREWFTTTVPLYDVKSIQDIALALAGVNIVGYPVDSVKDVVTLTVVVTADDGTMLLKSGYTFNLEKVYNRTIDEFVWQAPEWVKNLSFQLMDTYIPFAGATEAYLVRRENRGENDEVYNLMVVDGQVLLPGGWNHASAFKELVINGNHYDMNTGILLKPTTCNVQFNGVWVDGIEPVYNINGVNVTITAYPYWGYIPSYEVTVDKSYFKLEVVTSDRYWIHPIAVRFATLQDLRPGGKGWTTLPYSKGVVIKMDNPGTCYVIPEYQDEDISNGNSTTPVSAG